MQEVSVSCQGRPTACAQEELSGAGIVLPAWEMDQGRRRGLALLGTAPAEVNALAEPCLHHADRRGGRPIPLLHAGRDEPAVRRDGHAVRVAQSGGEHLDLVRQGQAQDPLVAGSGVESAGVIAVQTDHEVMASGRGRVGVENAFVEVRFAVGVEVMQAGDLVTAEDEHLAVHDFHAQRLMQAGGETAPGHGVARESLQDPDLSGHGAHGRRPVREEIQSADEEKGPVGICERHLDGVDGEGLLVALDDASAEFDWPAGGTALGHGLKRGLVGLPSGHETTTPILLIGEDHLVAMTVESKVAGAFRHDGTLLTGEGLADHRGSGGEPMSEIGETHEAAAPSRPE